VEMIPLRAVLNLMVTNVNRKCMSFKISDDTELMCSLCNLSYIERVGNFYVLSYCCD
jgi:hypothetical protein